MSRDPDHELPPAILPGEEPLVDLDAFDAATRRFITADDPKPIPTPAD